LPAPDPLTYRTNGFLVGTRRELVRVRFRAVPFRKDGEIRVNQSGSVALSAEEVRGPPRRLRTGGSWVQILPGAPYNQLYDLETWVTDRT